MFKEFDKDGDGNVTVGEVLQGVFTKISDLFTKETKEEDSAMTEQAKALFDSLRDSSNMLNGTIRRTGLLNGKR